MTARDPRPTTLPSSHQADARAARRLSDSGRQIIDILKRRARTAPELAADLGITSEAVRQQLRALESTALVVSQPRQPAEGGGRTRGRPPLEWVLTPVASELFPDRHGDLTVELLESIRRTVGEAGLDRIIADRNQRLLALYTDLARASGDPVQALADQRSAEGYLAEVREDPDGTRLLIEHHCPICDAAAACQGICRGELELFRRVLGDQVEVTREQHLLSGDDRCAYRISPKVPNDGQTSGTG